MSDKTLLDRFIEQRDRDRERLAAASTKVAEEDALFEENAHAPTRWYLHPMLPGRCINSTIVYRYELPPHSMTGLQRVQGNIMMYVISGYGRSEVDGVSHEWEAGDVIAIPPLMNGLRVRHENLSDEVAMLIAAEPNYIETFGVDLGSGFEQLEPRPGWEE